MARFSYSQDLIEMFPTLGVSVLLVKGITTDNIDNVAVERNLTQARNALHAAKNESNLPSIKAWRAAYRATGTNPTKYRMAAESILRRIRIHDDFPRLFPLVDLCNSISARFAIPVAALDTSKITGDLNVQITKGGEPYLGFDNSWTTLPSGEVTFLDEGGQAHARRWSHKQSKTSAVSATTKDVIITAEALHDDAKADLVELREILLEDLATAWPDAEIKHQFLTGPTLREGLHFS